MNEYTTYGNFPDQTAYYRYLEQFGNAYAGAVFGDTTVGVTEGDQAGAHAARSAFEYAAEKNHIGALDPEALDNIVQFVPKRADEKLFSMSVSSDMPGAVSISLEVHLPHIRQELQASAAGVGIGALLASAGCSIAYLLEGRGNTIDRGTAAFLFFAFALGAVVLAFKSSELFKDDPKRKVQQHRFDAYDE